MSAAADLPLARPEIMTPDAWKFIPPRRLTPEEWAVAVFGDPARRAAAAAFDPRALDALPPLPSPHT